MANTLLTRNIPTVGRFGPIQIPLSQPQKITPAQTISPWIDDELTLEMDERGGVVNVVPELKSADPLSPVTHEGSMKLDFVPASSPSHRLFENFRQDKYRPKLIPEQPTPAELKADYPYFDTIAEVFTAQEWRAVVATPQFQDLDFLKPFIEDFDFINAFKTDPNLYYLRGGVTKALKTQMDKEMKAAAVELRVQQKKLGWSNRLTKARIAEAEEIIKTKYAPLLRIVKNPSISLFEMIWGFSLMLPMGILSPGAEWMAKKLAETLSFLPGVHGPGELMSNGQAAPAAANTMAQFLDSYPSPHLYAVWAVTFLLTAWHFGGLSDSFKNSPIVMPILDRMENSGIGPVVNLAQRANAFIALRKPDKASSLYLYLFHGLIALEQSIPPEEFEQQDPNLMAVKNWMTGRKDLPVIGGLFATLGKALPGNKGEKKVYAMDLFIGNLPVFAFLVGVAPAIAAIIERGMGYPGADPNFAFASVPLKVAAAAGAGFLAWLPGVLNNTIITNYHRSHSPKETANLKAGVERQVYNNAQYLSSMMFLVPNFAWAWQQGAQLASGLAYMVGLSWYYNAKAKKSEPVTDNDGTSAV